MKRIVLLAVLAALASLAPAAAQPKLLTLKVATLPGDIGAQVWYAKDLGLFEKAGIDVQVTGITNGAAIASAVVSNAVDIGYSNVISIAVARSKGVPFTIIAGANLHLASAPTAGLLAVKADSPIRTAKELEGKTVAVSGLDNIVHYAVKAWIDGNGGDSSKVHFIEMPLPQMGAAVRTGRVDAAGMDAIGDVNLGKPGDSLRLLGSTFNAVSPNFLPSVWFTTEGWVSAHPDLAKKFVSVIRAAAAWANGHHAESAAILAKYTHLPPETLAQATRVTYTTVLTPELIAPNFTVAAKYGGFHPYPVSQLISPVAR